MDNQEFSGMSSEQIPALVVNHQISTYLFEIARWTKLLAIFGFVAAGLMVIIALFAGTLLSTIAALTGGRGIGAGAGMLLTVIYLLCALLIFLPTLYLYRFSVKTKAALFISDETGFTDAISNLKSYFKFNGIVAIVVLAFYALGIVGMIIGGIISAAM